MTPLARRTFIGDMVRCGCAMVVALMMAVYLATWSGIRFNYTHSYPIGFYKLTGAPLQKGALVIFCPMDTAPFNMAVARGYIGVGFCPGGASYMIKHIAAVQGDRVAITPEGVYVNDEILPNSRPMKTDSDHAPLPILHMAVSTLDAHSLLLMSDYSPKSFDARYFGLVDRSIVISAVEPLWTFDD